MADAEIIAIRTGDDAHFRLAGDPADIMALAMRCLYMAKKKARLNRVEFREHCRKLYKTVSTMPDGDEET